MSLEPKDIAAANLSASVSIAGLLLVFAGFIYSRGEAFDTRRRDRFRWWVKAGTAPFLIAIACAYSSFEGLLGNGYWLAASILLLRATILTTAIYGVRSIWLL